MNTKGVSPLIATILLIAFAVSVGAVVMNWTSTSEGVAHANEESICQHVSVQVLTTNGAKAICLDRSNNKIRIDFENGKTAIDGLRLSYLGKAANYVDYNQPIPAGVLSHMELEYDVAVFGELSMVRIIPFVKSQSTSYCVDQGERFSVIEDC